MLLIGTSDTILHHRAFGQAAVFDRQGVRLRQPETMTTGHLFDLASLTKIFATTYAVMHLHSRGLLDVDEPVYRYLPFFDTAGKRSITVRHLLSHSSGLMQWYPFYYVADNFAERLLFVAGSELIARPAEARSYSDPGFMILADLVELISGMPLEIYLKNGRVKVRLALAKGKQAHDKRETLRRRGIDRETQAAVKARSR